MHDPNSPRRGDSLPEPGWVREIAWRELFPWLKLLGTIRIALQARMMFLATVGLAVTLGGWWLISQAFRGSEDVRPLLAGYTSCVWNGDSQGVEGLLLPRERAPGPHLAAPSLLPFRDVWWQLGAPARQLYDRGVTFTSAIYLFACLLWSLATWAIFGGAITRITVLQIGKEQLISPQEAMRFSRAKFFSYIGGPLMPIAGTMIVALPLVIGGLLLRTDITAVAVALAWPLMLVGGLLLTVFLMGLFFGWPLMFVAISAEGSDSFDAVSRAYSYVQQRPLHYLFYAIIAAALSLLGTFFVQTFAAAVVELTIWGVSWGSGNARALVMTDASTDLTAAKVIWFWTGFVRLIALAFSFSYFWVAASAIYLFLRRHTDGAEFDEIYSDESTSESYGLPSLDIDAQGVPVVPKEE